MMETKKIWKKSIQIKFNWISLVFICLILTFGFFAYGSQDLMRLSLVQAGLFRTLVVVLGSLIVVMVSVARFYQGARSVSFDDSVTITHLDIKFFSVFLIFIVITALEGGWITRALTGDELAYAGIASNQSIQIIDLIPFSSETASYRSILWLISGVVAILLVLSIWVFLRLGSKSKILFSVISIMSLQLVGGFLGGSGFGYAKINTFPYVITTSFFGFSSTTYRITSIIIFCLLMMFMFKALVTWFEIHHLIAASLCIALGTIPLMSHHAVILEQPIFFFIFASLPLLEVFRSMNYRPERWVPFLVIGTYFRFTVVLSLIVYIFYGLLSSKGNRKKIIRIAPIVMVLLPYAMGLVSYPTSAVGKNYFEGISTKDMMLRFNVLVSALAISLDKLAIALVAFGLFTWLLKNLTSFLCGSMYIALVWLIYYEFTNPVILGFPKYQQEWAPVLLLFGIISVFKLFKQIDKRAVTNALLPVLLFGMVISNVIETHHVASRNTFVSNQESLENGVPFSLLSRDNHYVLSITPLPINEALLRVKRMGLSGNCFLSGPVYNVMPEILFGNSISETKQALNLRIKVLESQKFLKSDTDSIDSRSLQRANAECVILAGLPNIDDVEKDLTLNGWSKPHAIRDSTYSTSVSIWVK